MQHKLIKMYAKIQTAISNFKNEEKGAVDIVAIVILIAVAIGLVAIFRNQLSGLLQRWFGTIGTAGEDAVNQGTNLG